MEKKINNMFKKNIGDEQKQFSWHLIKEENIANRGEWDGNKKRQYAGKLAEVCFADLLELARPKAGGGFDHGIDFTIKGKNIDVKTVLRTCDVRENFGVWIKQSQIKYKTDFYVFTSINETTSQITFIGCLEKNQVARIGKLHQPGDGLRRADGTTMTLGTTSYCILASQLEPIGTVFELFMWLDRRTPNRPEVNIW